jgi:hypothetical protein
LYHVYPFFAKCHSPEYFQGPNYVYHVDGYDKLKPFGFAISGCIDGYSRRIMWLEVGPSNSNPRYIAKYYLDCIEINGGLLYSFMQSGIMVTGVTMFHSHRIISE